MGLCKQRAIGWHWAGGTLLLPAGSRTSYWQTLRRFRQLVPLQLRGYVLTTDALDVTAHAKRQHTPFQINKTSPIPVVLTKLRKSHGYFP